MLKKCAPLWREAYFQVKMYKTPHVRATFGGSDVEKVHLSIYLIVSLFIYITSEPPKVARTCGVLYILTWKYASRHSGAHFFNIRTSKSGANKERKREIDR